MTAIQKKSAQASPTLLHATDQFGALWRKQSLPLPAPGVVSELMHGWAAGCSAQLAIAKRMLWIVASENVKGVVNLVNQNVKDHVVFGPYFVLIRKLKWIQVSILPIGHPWIGDLGNRL